MLCNAQKGGSWPQQHLTDKTSKRNTVNMILLLFFIIFEPSRNRSERPPLLGHSTTTRHFACYTLPKPVAPASTADVQKAAAARSAALKDRCRRDCARAIVQRATGPDSVSGRVQIVR